MDTRQSIVKVKRIDAHKRIVFGEVYAPNQLDSYGEFMVADDIETMAHRFMRLDLSAVIDTQHDETPNGSYPVESFVARDGDPDFTPGAWVLGVKVEGDEVWERVLKGELNGFSFQSLVKPIEVDVTIEVVRDHFGKVEKAEAADDHDHLFFVQLNEAGRVIGGHTSVDKGHSHEIKHGTVTEIGSDGSAPHRFFL